MDKKFKRTLQRLRQKVMREEHDRSLQSARENMTTGDLQHRKANTSTFRDIADMLGAIVGRHRH